MPDKFLIAPMRAGLQRNMKPWMIQDNAFSELNNAYIYRGSLRKRPGSWSLGSIWDANALASRLRMDLGNTDGSGNIAGTVPGSVFKVGQMFSVGAELFTVSVLGAPGVMLKTGAATTHTYNTTTGAYVINGAAAATPCYFYPSTPVMGITNYEDPALNAEETIAFDRNFAYLYSGGTWNRLDGETVPGDSVWTGTNSDFFWSTNDRGTNADDYLLFTTNYTAADGMRYYDGTNWTTFRPAYLTAANYEIVSARIIIPFKSRLLVMNTIETTGGAPTTTYVNRIRYSARGESPLGADSWKEGTDSPGNGGVIDLPTKQAIVSAAIIKDRLIIYCERSTFEFVWTRNKITPFLDQYVNTREGCESTFSTVLFDRGVLGIGEKGIHACNGLNVERIDAEIPDTVFEFHNNDDGPQRIQAIRDYQSELVYWSVPHSENFATYPNQILALNYDNKTWSFFDDSITAFGYFYSLGGDIAWQNTEQEWSDITWSWNSGVNEDAYKFVLAGNQEGYTFLINPDFTRNARSLQITNITEAAGVVTITAIDHNLSSDDWIHIQDCQGITELNDTNFKIRWLSTDTFSIDSAPAVTGTYTGGGAIRLLSQIDVKTKEFGFYATKGLNSSINKIEFYVDSTAVGEITIDFIPSSSTISLRDDSVSTGAILGNSILDTYPYTITKPIEASQKRFWHAVYLQGEGEVVQLRIHMSDEQMSNTEIPQEDFQLNGIIFDVSPTGEF